MDKYNIIKQRLNEIYGKYITVRVGNSCNIEYSIGKDKCNIVDIAVYINKQYNLVAVWDVERRRCEEKLISTFSLNKNWEDIKLSYDEISINYKKMGSKKGDSYEKVIIFSVDTLNKIESDLYDYIQFDCNDPEYPDDLKRMIQKNPDYFKEYQRKKRSTSVWERSRKFREDILNVYDNQCAICRCKEKKILEAAHIKAVANEGNDEIDNGICLCANHHLMFDNNLIKIDFINNKLSYVSDTVKDMPWYEIFMKKYSGKLLSKKQK